MRIVLDMKYFGQPCSYVGTSCAFEDYFNKPFTAGLPEGLRANGFLSLVSENQYIRKWLPVRNKFYFKRGTRPLFRDFLRENIFCCCVCVYGHFVYVKGHDYLNLPDV